MRKEELTVANRVGTWVALAALGLYVINIGSWVGAADEKFEDAQKVEDAQDEIKERLVRVEEGQRHLDEEVKRTREEILEAIKELKEDQEDN